MTLSTSEMKARSSGEGGSLMRSKTRRDQVLFVAVGLALLAASAAMQNVLSSKRSGWNLVRELPDSEKSFKSLAVNFPRLTLGGFRGILSTILWQQAEDDKNERRWLELETKYDIIGALQPYFVSVYVYHAWNQAYNLSAQWQEQDTKYKWILDGQSYLYRGEDYNPGNADLYLEQGHLYFLKLGGAFERTYYRAHWRDDLSRLHELNDAKDVTRDATVALNHVRQFVNRVDSRDRTNAYFHVKELSDPEKRQPGTGWGVQVTDGFLFKDRKDGKGAEEPMEFRYGLSPFYFGYCEYKRCIAAGGPSSTGMQVLDGWPGMALRLWCRDDLYYSYQTMNELFGKNAKPDALDPKQPKMIAKVNEMRDCYRNVQMIGPRAIDLFNEHLGRYPRNEGIHRKHIMETQQYIALGKAEGKLLDAIMKWKNESDRIAPGQNGVTTWRTEARPNPELLELIPLYEEAIRLSALWVDKVYPAVIGEMANPDRADAQKYGAAMQARIQGIQALLSLNNQAKPDFSFIQDEVVEK